MSRLQQFGITFGYDRVIIYVEPKADARLTTNTARTALLLGMYALIVFVLADIGHSPATPAVAAAGARVAASLTVLAVAAVMALCGAYFTARR